MKVKGGIKRRAGQPFMSDKDGLLKSPVWWFTASDTAIVFFFSSASPA
jgi:hypothetical protein